MTETSVLTDPGFLSDLRRQMVKFAALQLSDSLLAEDAVQEALIGALKNAKSFAGRAALKTWVFAILRNKIADVLRQKQRMVDASSLLREDEEG
jgi:RNA polymerase sigma-70 factor (ECF subfamily)